MRLPWRRGNRHEWREGDFPAWPFARVMARLMPSHFTCARCGLKHPPEDTFISLGDALRLPEYGCTALPVAASVSTGALPVPVDVSADTLPVVGSE